MEAGFHNLREVRQQRIRRLDEIVGDYLVGYRLRYRSPTFAEYALGHVCRLLGAEMIVDIDEAAVLHYQETACARRPRLPLLSCSDDFVFDKQMLVQTAYFGFRMGEISCLTKYFDDASSINFRRSVVYGVGVLTTGYAVPAQEVEAGESCDS